MSFNATHIATATTTTVCDKPCDLHTLTLNEAASGSITINNDSTAIAIIASGTTAQTFTYDVAIGKSLNVVTAGADDVTVSWSQSGS